MIERMASIEERKVRRCKIRKGGPLAVMFARIQPTKIEQQRCRASHSLDLS